MWRIFARTFQIIRLRLVLDVLRMYLTFDRTLSRLPRARPQYVRFARFGMRIACISTPIRRQQHARQRNVYWQRTLRSLVVRRVDNNVARKDSAIRSTALRVV